MEAQKTQKVLEVYVVVAKEIGKEPEREKNIFKDEDEWLNYVIKHLDNCTIGISILDMFGNQLKSYHTSLHSDTSKGEAISKVSKVLNMYAKNTYDYYFDIQYKGFLYESDNGDGTVTLTDGDHFEVTVPESSREFIDHCKVRFGVSVEEIFNECASTLGIDPKVIDKIRYNSYYESKEPLKSLLDKLDVLYKN